jgi:hypothetical protein
METELHYTPLKIKRSPFPKIIPLLFIFLILIAGVIFVSFQQQEINGVACTQEARLCPDGSAVGRTGPNCSFAPCPTTQTQTNPPTSVFPSPTPAPTLFPTPTGSLSASCCSKTQLREGFECVPNCGLPVARADQTQTYSCLSPEDAKNRKYYGCPICLAANTMIQTPLGERNIKSIQVGDFVYTQNKSGKRISEPVIRTFMAKTGTTHPIIHLVLSDKRELWVSPYHPLKNGMSVQKLRIGDYYDNAVVRKVDLINYDGTATYDILPKGDTGFYWANNILMGSTLKK